MGQRYRSVSCISATRRLEVIPPEGAGCSMLSISHKAKDMEILGSKVETRKPVTTLGDSVE